MVTKKPKRNGYKTYLIYKKILEQFTKGDCGRQAISECTGISYENTLNLLRVLEAEHVIKRVSYNLDPKGGKQAIYGLIKSK